MVADNPTGHRAPLALASDGSLLVNVYHWDGANDPQTLLRQAAASGRPVFIGVVAAAHCVDDAFGEMDDAAASIAGKMLARMMCRGRQPLE